MVRRLVGAHIQASPGACQTPKGAVWVPLPLESTRRRPPIHDFRRVHRTGSRKPSVDLRDAVADVLVKQDWYWDFRTAHNEPPLACVGRFSIQSSVREVAEDIRSTLDFENEVRVQDRSRFLSTFVSQVEAQGILVMRNGIVRQATNRALDVDEFRGFSIADPMARVIFINNADSKRCPGIHAGTRAGPHMDR